MKKSPLLPLLAGLQVVASIALAVVCILQIQYGRQLNDQNAAMLRYNVDRQFLNSLLTDCVKYGERNPAIHPLLAAAGVQPPAMPAPATKPAPAKPTTR